MKRFCQIAARGPWWILVACAAVYVISFPPLYNRDGFVYMLQAGDPLAHLNAHHLAWLPLEALGLWLARVSRLAPMDVLQTAGVWVNLLTLAGFFRLVRGLTRGAVMAAAWTIFLAFSPQFWFLGFQNQPYPLMMACLVLFLSAIQEMEQGHRLTLMRIEAGVALVAATCLQQAGVLLIMGGAAAWMIGTGRRGEGRWRSAILWAGASGTLVALIYLAAAAQMGIHTLEGLRSWLTDYMQSQHGIQIELWRALAQSTIGIGRTLVQLHRAELYLANHWHPGRILALYGGMGVMLLLVFLVSWKHRPIRRRAAPLWKTEPLVRYSLCLMVAWAVFAIGWEPAAYYWVVTLIPFVLLAARLVAEFPLSAQRVVGSMLLLFSLWNIQANRRFDRDSAVRAPGPLLEAVESRLDPRDLLLVPARDWLGDVDYDVLLTAWDFSKRVRAATLLEDFVLKEDASGAWNDRLKSHIDETLKQGGTVYISDLLWRPEIYQELQGGDAYAVYHNDRFERVSGLQLFRAVEALLATYRRRPTPIHLNSDQLWEITRP